MAEIKVKDALDVVSLALDNIMDTVSPSGECRMRNFIDEAHWLLFERDEKPSQKKGKRRVAWAISEHGDTTVKVQVFGLKKIDKKTTQKLEEEISNFHYKILLQSRRHHWLSGGTES